VFERAHSRLRAARNGDKGFTLIELLIVIVILGVLAGIVVFSVQFINNRGENASCKTDLKNVESAVEAYYAQFGSYPTAIDGAANSTTLIGKGVLKDVPNNTAGGYTINYDAATHTVSASGANAC
jgi:type II secretion system protein G